MAEFLSAEWIGELATAVAGYGGFDSIGAEVVIDQVVQLDGGGELRYRVRLFPGGGEVTTDPSAAALRAQDALAAGALKVRGSPERIARSAEALAALSAASAPVRARTTFADEAADAGPGQQ